MATVFEDYTTEEQRPFLCGQKVLNTKDIHKEIFPIYGEKYLSLKAVHIWVKIISEGRSKVEVDARLGAEVAETTAQRLLCYGFRRTGKAIRPVYQCWWKICKKKVKLSL
jgi:hypothetical protein